MYIKASRKRKTELAIKNDAKLQSGLESNISAINKKPKANSDQFNSGVYTDSEEILFLEGLELYGRQWSKVVYYSHFLSVKCMLMI